MPIVYCQNFINQFLYSATRYSDFIPEISAKIKYVNRSFMFKFMVEDK